jgi:hypothetical protein
MLNSRASSNDRRSRRLRNVSRSDVRMGARNGFGEGATATPLLTRESRSFDKKGSVKLLIICKCFIAAKCPAMVEL